jgi:hypothetical protein
VVRDEVEGEPDIRNTDVTPYFFTGVRERRSLEFVGNEPLIIVMENKIG